MFPAKKPVAFAGKHKLSGADRKKLRKTLEKKIPSIDDAALETILPAKGDLSMAKLGAPNKGIVYFNDKEPVLVDVNGKGDFLAPTVFSLWKVPQLVPCFEVSTYIVGKGADLMLPGVRIPSGGFPPHGDGSWARGEVFSVMVPGNPMPIAVGTTLMSSAETAEGSGKLLQVVTHYGDALWATHEDKPRPNDGFLANGVVALGGSMDDPMEGEEGSTEEGEESGEEVGSGDESAAAGEEEAAAAAGSGERPAGSATADGDEVEGATSGSAQGEGELADRVAALEVEEGQVAGEASEAPAEDADEAGEAKMSPSEMDALLEVCLLQALRTTAKDKVLPLTQGQFWNAHILLARPPDTKLDVRLSSYKKLAKFLEAKAKDGLLTVKVDKKTKELQVVGVNRGHEALRSFTLLPVTVGSEAAAAEAADAAANSERKTLEIVEVYKPAHDSMPVFEPMGGSKGNLYTYQELVELLKSYSQKMELGGAADNQARDITLDPALSDALFKGLLKKGDPWPTTIPKSELVKAFVKRQAPHHVVLRGKDQLIGKGSPSPLEVHTDKRSGNKKVTRVVGLEGYLLSPSQVATDLQRLFSGAASVQELPGKKVMHEVVIQGDHASGIVTYLMEEWSIPKALIKKVDTSSGKGKK